MLRLLICAVGEDRSGWMRCVTEICHMTKSPYFLQANLKTTYRLSQQLQNSVVKLREKSLKLRKNSSKKHTDWKSISSPFSQASEPKVKNFQVGTIYLEVLASSFKV
jgi:hypothetical protein